MSSSGDRLTTELYQRELQGWENFKRKDKLAYAAAIADDAAGFDLTGVGLKHKAAIVADVDLADVTHYEMRDFKAERITDDVALVHFFASFSGTAEGQPIEVKMFIGEVLVKREGRWLVRWFQNSPVGPFAWSR